MDLDQLAIQYGTDKSSNCHDYCRTYQDYFQSRRSDNLKILELGVQSGISLQMWADYFPNSHIYGVDIVPVELSHDRITVLQGDSSDRIFLSELSKTGFDIIIDDASHINSHQIIAFDVLFTTMSPGGIYVVEDLHTSYHPLEIWRDIPGQTALDYFKNLVDEVNFKDQDTQGIGNYKMVPGFETSSELRKAIRSIHFYKSIAFILKH